MGRCRSMGRCWSMGRGCRGSRGGWGAGGGRGTGGGGCGCGGAALGRSVGEVSRREGAELSEGHVVGILVGTRLESVAGEGIGIRRRYRFGFAVGRVGGQGTPAFNPVGFGRRSWRGIRHGSMLAGVGGKGCLGEGRTAGDSQQRRPPAATAPHSCVRIGRRAQRGDWGGEAKFNRFSGRRCGGGWGEKRCALDIGVQGP